MNLGEAVTQTRLYINEKVPASWKDVELKRLIVDANYELAAMAAGLNQDLFARDRIYQIQPNTLKIGPLDQIAPVSGTPIGLWQKVTGVWFLSKTYNTLEQAKNEVQAMEAVTNMGKMFDRNGRESPLQFKVRGRNLWIWPPQPTQSYYIYVSIIPVVNKPVNDSDPLLDFGEGSVGELPEWHELIPMLAALKAKSGQSDSMQPVATIYKAKLDAFSRAVAIMQQTMTPARGGM